MVAFVIFSAKRNCGGWAFIPCCVDDFVLTWLPHSRYPWVFWTWTKTCFFSHPLGKALEDTLTKHLKVSSTAGVEVQPLGRGLWNTGKGFRHPLLKLLLSIFSREGWRKNRQKSFCNSPIASKAIWQDVFSPPSLRTCFQPWNSHPPLTWLYSLFCLCGFFRPFLAYFLLFQIVIICFSLFCPLEEYSISKYFRLWGGEVTSFIEWICSIFLREARV